MGRRRRKLCEIEWQGRPSKKADPEAQEEGQQEEGKEDPLEAAWARGSRGVERWRRRQLEAMWKVLVERWRRGQLEAMWQALVNRGEAQEEQAEGQQVCLAVKAAGLILRD